MGAIMEHTKRLAPLATLLRAASHDAVARELERATLYEADRAGRRRGLINIQSSALLSDTPGSSRQTPRALHRALRLQRRPACSQAKAAALTQVGASIAYAARAKHAARHGRPGEIPEGVGLAAVKAAVLPFSRFARI